MKGEVRLINGKRMATTEYRSWQMMKNRCLNPKAAHHMIWQVREKDRGDTTHFQLSAEREELVRRFLDGSHFC